MPSVAITPGRMEILARALDRAVASAVVPRPRIDELRSSFAATDVQGRSWTIDLESHRWGCLHGGRWMVEDPPQQLFLDSDLRASLEALEAMAARAIMTGTDALQAPRTSWFRTPVQVAEPAGMPSSIPSWGSATPPQQPLERKQAPVAEPARSPESMSSRASVSGTAEPATRTSEGMPTAAAPVEKGATSRRVIPAAHLRFAGPFAPVSADLAAPALAAVAASDGTAAPDRMPASATLPVPPRDASSEHERWVPTSIAPRLTSVRPEAPDDRAHVVLCGVLAALFFALASWKGDGRGYAAALLFGLLTVVLLVLNLARSRHD